MNKAIVGKNRISANPISFRRRINRNFPIVSIRVSMLERIGPRQAANERFMLRVIQYPPLKNIPLMLVERVLYFL